MIQDMRYDKADIFCSGRLAKGTVEDGQRMSGPMTAAPKPPLRKGRWAAEGRLGGVADPTLLEGGWLRAGKRQRMRDPMAISPRGGEM